MKNNFFNSQAYYCQSIKLKNYDYSQNGYYFVTICTKDKQSFFGKIRNDKMNLNRLGRITEKCWQEIPKHYPDVILHEYVIMPNHIHGIIEISKNGGVGVQNLEPLRVNQYQKTIPKSLGSIVRGFKIGVTKWTRQNTNIQTIWQRNYYEHIIRNDKSLNQIREYIVYNPEIWEKDSLFVK